MAEDKPVEHYTPQQYQEIIVTMGNALGALFICINNSAEVANGVLAVLADYKDIVGFSYREYLKSQGLEVPEEFTATDGKENLTSLPFSFPKDKKDGLVM